MRMLLAAVLRLNLLFCLEGNILINFIDEYVSGGIIGLIAGSIASAKRLKELEGRSIPVVNYHGRRLDAIDVHPSVDPLMGYEDPTIFFSKVLLVLGQKKCDLSLVFWMLKAQKLSVA